MFLPLLLAQFKKFLHITSGWCFIVFQGLITKEKKKINYQRDLECCSSVKSLTGICFVNMLPVNCHRREKEEHPDYAFYYNSALLTVHIILQQALNCIWSCKIDWETNKWLRALRRHDKDQCVYRIPENSFCIFGSLQRWIWNTSQYDFPESYLQIAA